MMRSPGCCVMEEGARTSAVTAWERRSASSITSWPVRPLPPRRRICARGVIVVDMFRMLRSVLCDWFGGFGGVGDVAVMVDDSVLRNTR